MFIASVFVGVGCLIYFLSRYVYIGVQSAGGSPAIVLFKPSFIEGKTVDGDSTDIAGKIIQALVDLKSSKP
jgi:hypothetical protein